MISNEVRKVRITKTTVEEYDVVNGVILKDGFHKPHTKTSQQRDYYNANNQKITKKGALL